jgi:hypothetical protein
VAWYNHGVLPQKAGLACGSMIHSIFVYSFSTKG